MTIQHRSKTFQSEVIIYYYPQSHLANHLSFDVNDTAGSTILPQYDGKSKILKDKNNLGQLR